MVARIAALTLGSWILMIMIFWLFSFSGTDRLLQGTLLWALLYMVITATWLHGKRWGRREAENERVPIPKRRANWP